MKPIDQIPKGKIKAIFSDLDDTLTSDGRLPAKVIEAFDQLKKKDFWLVIVSGRPAGWADCLMRLFPLDAMIFENGAGLMLRDGKKVLAHNLASVDSLQDQHRRLTGIFNDLKKQIPHLRLATDQFYRLFDFAIDICEEPPHLSDKEVEQILKRLDQEKDLTAKLSSIHINYWCGKHTKVTASQYLIESEGAKRGVKKEQITFTGDSPNDEPLFEFFDYSVGVRNIEKYLPKMKHPPKFITKSDSADGFYELASHLLS